jgi:hypothetical protein
VSVALSGRGHCAGPNTRPEESYRVWCGCDIESSKMSRNIFVNGPMCANCITKFFSSLLVDGDRFFGQFLKNESAIIFH